MTLMLRSPGHPGALRPGIPARPAELGRDVARCPMAAAHAWVEVYFPDVGWVRFDPTPGGGQRWRTASRPRTCPWASPCPRPRRWTRTDARSHAGVHRPSRRPHRTRRAATPPPTPTPPDAGFLGLDLRWPLAAAARPGGRAAGRAGGRPCAACAACPGRSRTCCTGRSRRSPTRVGHGPRPDQTPYEFTAPSREVVPGAGRDLHAVARAKVESTYGRRPPEGDAARRAAWRAYRRARIGRWCGCSSAEAGVADAGRGQRAGQAPRCRRARGRQVVGEVVGAQPRHARPQLDDGDPAQRERERPERVRAGRPSRSSSSSRSSPSWATATSHGQGSPGGRRARRSPGRGWWTAAGVGAGAGATAVPDRRQQRAAASAARRAAASSDSPPGAW